MTWAVVPVKQLSLAKSRLAQRLDVHQRAGLVLTMLGRVLDALAASRGVQECLVVTADPQVVAFARARAARIMHELPGGGLNAALIPAAHWLRHRDVSRMLIVPADIPLVRAADFDRLLACGQDAATVLVRAKDGSGTGALLGTLPLPFAPMFGPASFLRHCSAAATSGVLVHDSPRIALDIDEPQDLDLWRSLDERIDEQLRSRRSPEPVHG